MPSTRSHDPLLSRTWLKLPLELLAWIAFGLMAAAASTLAPFRLGRLLRLVTLPRLRKHRLRSTLTVFGVALGVALLVAVILVNASVLRTVSATVDDLAGNTDLQISAGSSGFAEALLERVKSVPGVAHAVPIVQQTVSVRDARGRGERLLLLGVDMLGDDAQFRHYASAELEAIQHDPLAFLNSTRALLLSQSFAARLGYGQHATITLATSRGPQAFQLWGTLEGRGVGSAFGGAVGVMYYQAMQAAFDRGENIDRIDVVLSPAADGGKVARALQQTLGPGFVVEAPARKGERIGKMLAGVQSGLTIASLIALLVGGFLIHNTMSISVVQRRRELGTLRALGTRKRELVALLTLEGAVMGVAGACAGVCLGLWLARLLLYATSYALSQTYLELGPSEVVVRWQVLLAGGLLGVCTAIVASALPARRAATAEPAEVLRTANAIDARNVKPRICARDLGAAALLVAPWGLLRLPAFGGLPIGAFAAAAALLAAGALLLPRLVQFAARVIALPARRWLSIEARLANGNLVRDLGRTSVSASALMSGVALAVGFGAFTHSFAVSLSQWVDQTLPGDLFITRGARMASTTNMPMNDALYAQLRSLPEVSAVRRVRIAELPFAGYTTKVVSSDIDVFGTRSHLHLLEGTNEAVVAALHAGALLVSENFSRHFHVHRGDSVELSTRRFAVAGVFVDYTSDVGTLLFDRAQYVRAFQDARVDTYELYLRDPSASEHVRRSLLASLDDADDYYVLTSAEFRGSIRQTTDGLFGLVRALEFVALIVAVLGILNAQFANVLDRMRELAVLRAVGMLPGQLRRMVVFEAALVGSVGTCAGIALGFAFGYVLLDHVNLVQTGWYFPYRVPVGSIVEVTCLTIPAAAVAGVYPALTAARRPLSEALAQE